MHRVDHSGARSADAGRRAAPRFLALAVSLSSPQPAVSHEVDRDACAYCGDVLRNPQAVRRFRVRYRPVSGVQVYGDDLCADLGDISGQISGAVGHDVSSIMLFPARQLEFPIVGAERRAANIGVDVTLIMVFLMVFPAHQLDRQ